MNYRHTVCCMTGNGYILKYFIGSCSAYCVGTSDIFILVIAIGSEFVFLVNGMKRHKNKILKNHTICEKRFISNKVSFLQDGFFFQCDKLLLLTKNNCKFFIN